MALKSLYGIFLAQLEGNDEIRPQLPGELSRHHGRVAAVGAGGGRRIFVADELCAAAGTAVGPHTIAALRAPVLGKRRGVPRTVICGRCTLSGFLCRLLSCRGFFFLLCVKRLDLCYIVTGAAVFTLQLPGRSHEMERTRTSRTLIIGYLCWHRNASFPYRCCKAPCRSRPGTTRNLLRITSPGFR